MDTRGKCVTVAIVLAIHIGIHVACVFTVAAVLAIHIWIHVASGWQWLQYGDTHMDSRCEWVTVAAVLPIHIWIHVAIG